MTELVFDSKGADVFHNGVEFRMKKQIIEEATKKEYRDVTDHEVKKLIEDPEALDLEGEPRRIGDILDGE